MLALTWSSCYRWPLSSNPVIWTPIEKLVAKAPALSQKLSTGISKIPLPPRVTEAYLESSCFRKLVRPITLPGKLWLTYECLKAINGPGEGKHISFTSKKS